MYESSLGLEGPYQTAYPTSAINVPLSSPRVSSKEEPMRPVAEEASPKPKSSMAPEVEPMPLALVPHLGKQYKRLTKRPHCLPSSPFKSAKLEFSTPIPE